MQRLASKPVASSMEATAAYHELAATRLHCAGLVVSVVNPALARSLAKGLGMLSKTDTIDALLLAQYARLAKPRQWHPVAAQLQQFSALLMRLDCLEADLRREQNRREQAVVRGTCECVIASIDSCIAFLKIQCKAMRQAIEAHIQANAALRDGVARLRTIPAVGEKTATAWWLSWKVTILKRQGGGGLPGLGAYTARVGYERQGPIAIVQGG